LPMRIINMKLSILFLLVVLLGTLGIAAGADEAAGAVNDASNAGTGLKELILNAIVNGRNIVEQGIQDIREGLDTLIGNKEN